MISQEIKNFVIQQIQAASSANRFQLTTIPRHIHNGIDSPLAFQPILTYVGLILINGSIKPPASGAAAGVLPTGWTVDHSATGDYTITHSLNSTAYAVVASPIGTTTQVSIAYNKNLVEFTWFDTATQASIDTPFFFLLTNVTNKIQTLPSYIQIA